MANKLLIDVKSFGLKLSDSITAKRICNVIYFFINCVKVFIRVMEIQFARLLISY